MASIGADISGVWHKHPYVVLGLVALVALYFLWPSSSSSSQASGSSTSSQDYASELAAQTSLSEAQISAQQQSAQIAAESQALEAAAASSAAGQEAQAAASATSAQAQSSAVASAAQSQAASSNFSALIAGLTAFGNSATAQQGQILAAGSNPLDTFLTSAEQSSYGSNWENSAVPGWFGGGSPSTTSSYGTTGLASLTSAEVSPIVNLGQNQANAITNTVAQMQAGQYSQLASLWQNAINKVGTVGGTTSYATGTGSTQG